MADQIRIVQLNGKTLSRPNYFSLVNYNDDYYIQVIGDELPLAAEGWMICGDQVYKHFLDAEGKFKVPGAFMASPSSLFGVTWDGFASTAVRITVIESIRGIAEKLAGEPYEQPDESEVQQLIALVNSIAASSGLPDVTAADDGKIAQVKNGRWNVQHPELGEDSIHFLTNMELEALLQD